ncbi:hypothetical protein [Nannocystis pusilla]|uniref:hypothetical protein n=1 Tax=Nannocystis pusilla TaxID=889268 RepID=UPI003B77D92F
MDQRAESDVGLPGGLRPRGQVGSVAAAPERELGVGRRQRTAPGERGLRCL